MYALRVKVAIYQAPLLPSGSLSALNLIRDQVRACEAAGVAILCSPEAILGGLADDAIEPAAFAIAAQGDELQRVLAPLASDTVTTIVGFTEIDRAGRFFNAAAVFHQGKVLGRYRKLHPAINRSIYSPGRSMPVFSVGTLTFGVIICNDSNYEEPVRVMASRGAAAVFVPSNNGMPAEKGGRELVVLARDVDRTHAMRHGITMIRADVAGECEGRISYGSSGIVSGSGSVLAAGPPLAPALLIAEIDPAT